jgi:hypothetical protein
LWNFSAKRLQGNCVIRRKMIIKLENEREERDQLGTNLVGLCKIHPAKL